MHLEFIKLVELMAIKGQKNSRMSRYVDIFDVELGQ
jgi:hypothetical protein